MSRSADSAFFGRRLAVIAAGAFALRILVRVVAGTSRYWADGYTQYALLADSLAAGRGYAFPGGPPTAFRVPLYPLFVAATTWGSRNPWPLIAAQAAVSAALVIIAALLARRLYGTAAGLVAAAWCAVYPYYVWHDVSLQESGLLAAIAALASLLLLMTRASGRPAVPIIAGATLGLAILTRSAIVPFALLALGWLLLPDRRALWRRLLNMLLCAVAMLAVLTPWLVREHSLTGTYGLGTEFGQSLYAGASPQILSAFPERSVDAARAAIFGAIPPQEAAARARFAQGNPARESEWYAARALEIAKADPSGYASRAIRKLGIAFGPWPAPRHGWFADAAYALCWLPLLMLGLAGLWRDRANWRQNSLFAAHFAGFSAVTAVVWAQTAHRAYLDVYLMVLAAPVVVGWLPQRVREALAR